MPCLLPTRPSPCFPSLLALQLAADQLWAPAGHEVQTVQLPLTGLLPPQRQPQPQRPQQQGTPPLSVEDEGDSICIRSSRDGWELRFSQATGGLASWTDGSGRQLLAAPLSLCFYRAPTDNDRGGSGGSSYAARWVGSGTGVAWAGTHVGCFWATVTVASCF